MLQQWLRSDGPVSERYFQDERKSKESKGGKGQRQGKGRRKKEHEDGANAHIEQFNRAWAAASNRG